jgi:transcriptional activator of cad operon
LNESRMLDSATTMLRVGAWVVNPASGEMSREGETVRLEMRTMRLLLCLAERRGEVVSIDDLIRLVWTDVVVSPDSVYQAVASLRRHLGDDPKQPNYIVNVPRLGYRMVAPVSPWTGQPVIKTSSSPAGGDSAAPVQRRGSVIRAFAWAVGAVLCFALVVGFLSYDRFTKNGRSGSSAAAHLPEKSIAVLPFLDLTQGMKEEEFADGLTEELIDKLAKIPGVRVPAPTASFFFKGKQVSIADIARMLGVIYVLDGSVRRSGAWLRVAVRLVRADNGYVLWSETYDRPYDTVLTVQDEIATEATKALRASIESGQEDHPSRK